MTDTFSETIEETIAILAFLTDVFTGEDWSLSDPARSGLCRILARQEQLLREAYERAG